MSSDKGETEIPLHPIERKLLVYLSSRLEGENEWHDSESIVTNSGLSHDQLRRAIEWTKSKTLVEERVDESISYALGPEGRKAIKEGLPERKIISELERSGGTLALDTLAKILGAEFSVGFGIAKQRNWIKIADSKIILDSTLASQKEDEETLLENVAQKGKLVSSAISAREQKTIQTLQRRHRGLLQESKEKIVRIRLTSRGLELAKTAGVDQIDEITSQVILDDKLRSKPLRPINVTSPAPSLYGGRKHPIRMFIDEVKEVFVGLGFEEIEGTMSQSALWNFDALFIPQQHPTREMQDTFYISDAAADLEKYHDEKEVIKSSHESGGKTGSMGWRYNWSEEEARRVVLRTHTTAVTIRYLSDNQPKEARVFSVGKVFRNEKPNYKHLPEFYQIEGVTVGPKLNVRNLIYIISKFYSKLGFDKIKFWPTYFPYTEPSLQTVAFYERKQKWLELGGMGVFRPEVTIPLGVENPVLAWGLGMDRLVMLRYDLDDIRDLFGPNLGWLRNAKVL